MTVKLPQKAGFVATTAEWDQLVRIAENLAAQVVQRDSALMQMQAERDAARDELRVLRGIAEDTEGWAALFGTASRDALLIEATIKGLRAIHAGSVEALDATHAEVARLAAALGALIEQADVAWATLDHTENERLVSRLGCAADDARAALRQPAQAHARSTSDGVTWHTFGGNTPPEQVAKPAPAGVGSKTWRPKDLARIKPAPAQYPIDNEPCENCVHGKKWHWDGGKCQNACPCEQYKPAQAQE